jgi:hypothetical protein
MRWNLCPDVYMADGGKSFLLLFFYSYWSHSISSEHHSSHNTGVTALGEISPALGKKLVRGGGGLV